MNIGELHGVQKAIAAIKGKKVKAGKIGFRVRQKELLCYQFRSSGFEMLGFEFSRSIERFSMP